MNGIQGSSGVIVVGGANLSAGLLRHFKMNDDAATTAVVDATGTANGVAARNTEDFNATGKINGALDFNGTTDLIDCASDFIGTTALTICAWINPTSDGETDSGTIVNNGKIDFRFSSTEKDRVAFSSNGAAFAFPADNSITMGIYQFVCVTRTTAGVANLYVNGILTGAADQDSGAPEVGTTNVIIGNDNGATKTFDGKIDDVRIYSRVLNMTQIRAIYNAGIGTEL